MAPDAIANTRPADLVMVVPLGLDPSIFPWGPHLVLDAARKARPLRRCELWDLRKEPVIVELANNSRALLEVVLLGVPSDQRPLFFGHTQNVFLLYELAVTLGSGLATILGLSAAHGIRLRELQEAHFAAVKKAFIARKHRRGTVYAISIYDYTALGALAVARRLKEIDPSCQVIAGGDYIDESTARLLVAESAYIDAAVFGYGEDPIIRMLDWIDKGHSLKKFSATKGRTGTDARTKAESGNFPERPHLQSAMNAIFEAGRLRILTQRGCSWSECTFCSQMDRHAHVPLDLEAIARAIETHISQCQHEEGELDVSLDSDENDVAAVTQISRTIASTLPSDRHASLEFWLMVRSYRPELCKVALETKNSMKHHVRMNIESLSLGRLRLMKKGFSPLQALEALKACIDCGIRISTNYFSFYPGEESEEDTLEEARLLATASHLLLAPALGISSFPYAMNGRDEVAAKAQDFKLNLARQAESWMREAHSLDLPYSIWAQELQPSPECPALTAAEIDWHARRKEYLASLAGLSTLRGKVPEAAEVALLLRKEIDAVRSSANRLQAVVDRESSQARTRRLSVLNAILAFKRGGRIDQAGKLLRQHVLSLDGRQLTACAPNEQATRLELDDQDLEMLRLLYWTRRRSEFQMRFPSGATRLARFLDEGWVIEQRGHLLSLVNDPGYWLGADPCTDFPKRMLQSEVRQVAAPQPAMVAVRLMRPSIARQGAG